MGRPFGPAHKFALEYGERTRMLHREEYNLQSQQFTNKMIAHGNLHVMK